MLKTQLDRAVEDMEVKFHLRMLYGKPKQCKAQDFRKLDFILLSGGLGCSKYVEEEVKKFIKENNGSNQYGDAFHPSLGSHTEVVVTDEPRLSIVLGLLDILSSKTSRPRRRDAWKGKIWKRDP